MKRTLMLFSLCSLFFVLACKKSNNATPTDCTGVTAKFSTDAQPVFNSSCATNSGCHAAGASNSGGALTNYNEIKAKVSNIRSAVSNGSMPQGSSLTAAQKQAIICWIDNGAQNN